MRALFAPLTLVGAVVGTVAIASCGDSKAATEGPRYRTQKVERGTLQATVDATGTLQAATQVELGSRLSGQLKRVLVDFNDSVTTGQLLAEIDPAPFLARQAEARASVAAARAEQQRADADLVIKEQNAQRAKELAAKQLNSTAELQAAVGALEIAKASVSSAKAQFERAQASLQSATADVDATKIISPIDGIVLARAVEAGQTVAASLQSPRLFVIAKALDALEVVAKVDESDLAIVRKDAEAVVTVDAFPGKSFPAVVSQIRIDATNENGVVTFPVVLSVENSDRLLLPGMTATVSIKGPPIEDALIVPAAALRFSPSTGGKKATGGSVWILDKVKAPVDAGAPADSGERKGEGRGGAQAGEPRSVTVSVLQKAGTRVQVESDKLKEGDAVIVEETGGASGGRRRTPPRVF